MKTMTKWQKMLAFIMLFLGIVGSLGSIGYSLYLHEYVITAGVVVLSVFAAPSIINCFNALRS